MGKYEYQIFCSIGGCFGTGRMWCDNTPNPEMLKGANFVATGNGTDITLSFDAVEKLGIFTPVQK